MKNYILLVAVLVLAIACQSGSQREKETKSADVSYTEVTLAVSGMHCAMCEASIEKGLAQLAGVDSVNAILDDSVAYVRYNPQLTTIEEITETIVKRGYTVKSNL
jgi:copper chaperone